MYLVMNRFKVRAGREADFEHVWATRESHLGGVPGFRGFRLLRHRPMGHGDSPSPEVTLYASHTEWESEAAFRDWTRSEAFRKAHEGAGGHGDLYAAAPQLEVFEAVLEDMPEGAAP